MMIFLIVIVAALIQCCSVQATTSTLLPTSKDEKNIIMCRFSQSSNMCGVLTNETSLYCPYKHGVCCNVDNTSNTPTCCPSDHICRSDSRQLCIQTTHLGVPNIWKLHAMVPLLEHTTSTNLIAMTSCPLGKLACPGNSTCCPGPYIGYDCCPIPNGICCADFQHCCPPGYNCDLKSRNCVRNNGKASWYKKLKATEIKKKECHKSIDAKLQNIKCRDNVTICHDTDTCCPIGGGKYGCCPMTHAVCCSDYEHCCPSGTQCDVTHGRCTGLTNGNQQAAALMLQIVQRPRTTVTTVDVTPKKLTRFAHKINPLSSWIELPVNATIVCPGGQFSCPDWMTCCSTGGQKYGCCPFPNAVCCSDNEHCCPHGAVCDLVHDRCNRGGLFVPLFNKIEAKAVNKVNNICPDKYSCPDTTTCCQLPSSSYGCCPYSNAVCCDDHVHCCPHGSVCDTAARGCRQGNSVHLDPFIIIKANVTHAICPGGQYQCQDKTSCCQSSTGKLVCCPYENGICCKNSKFCCPHGYKCDDNALHCVTNEAIVP